VTRNVGVIILSPKKYGKHSISTTLIGV